MLIGNILVIRLTSENMGIILILLLILAYIYEKFTILKQANK